MYYDDFWKTDGYARFTKHPTMLDMDGYNLDLSAFNPNSILNNDDTCDVYSTCKGHGRSIEKTAKVTEKTVPCKFCKTDLFQNETPCWKCGTDSPTIYK
jgi:hypothetical protein